MKSPEICYATNVFEVKDPVAFENEAESFPDAIAMFVDGDFSLVAYKPDFDVIGFVSKHLADQSICIYHRFEEVGSRRQVSEAVAFNTAGEVRRGTKDTIYELAKGIRGERRRPRRV